MGKGNFSQQKQDRQVPESFQLAPDSSLIIREICQFYNVSEQDLLTARRGRSNVPRDVAIYLCRVLRNDTLKKIGTSSGMTGYGPAGNAVNRVKDKMLKNRELGQAVEKIKNRLCNSRKSLQ